MNETIKILLIMIAVWIGVCVFLYLLENHCAITIGTFMFIVLNVWLYWIIKLMREKYE